MKLVKSNQNCSLETYFDQLLTKHKVFLLCKTVNVKNYVFVFVTSNKTTEILISFNVLYTVLYINVNKGNVPINTSLYSCINCDASFLD